MQKLEHEYDVSIVITSYNHAQQLGTAINSALGQSGFAAEIIIVDDASTDESIEVIRQFSQRYTNVVAIALPTNSGGSGRPRNIGLSKASGRYVMFLDSDDELIPGGCLKLLTRGVEDGAEIVAGKTLRRRTDSGEVRTWYEGLYSEDRCLSSIEDYPEFIHDTISTNKLYYRDFLLSRNIFFPEDIKYEDVVFSAQTLVSAKRISIIKEPVYYWNVTPDAEVKSVTNNLISFSNFRDRVEAIDRSKRLLEHAPMSVKREFDLKCLKHHFLLYLRLFPDMSATVRSSILDVLNAELSQFDIHIRKELNNIQQLIYLSIESKNKQATYALLEGLQTNSVPGWFQLIGDKYKWYFYDRTGKKVCFQFDANSYIDKPSEITHDRVVKYRISRRRVFLEGYSFIGKLSLLHTNVASKLVLGEESYEVETLHIDPLKGLLIWKSRVTLPRRKAGRQTTGLAFLIRHSLSPDSDYSKEGILLPVSDLHLTFPDISIFGRLLGDKWVLKHTGHGAWFLEIEPSRIGTWLRKTLRAFR